MKPLRWLSCLISASVMAQDNIDLRITPGLCVIENDGEICVVPLQAQWQHPNNDMVSWCLHQVESSAPLLCESEQRALHRAKWQAQLSHSTTFELRSEQQPIAQAQVTVVKLVTDVRPRRRHGWGLM